jgi:RNA polymerase sigma factor (sigma-70 family)
MAKEPLGNVLHYLRQIASAPASQELTDKELLESFAAGRDETAFALLMQRHGALVWGVCQRVLRQDQDAEDAFQATFFVLARKAGRIRWQADVGNWLYAVALRTALKAKGGATRRNRGERQLQDMPAPEPNCDSAWLDLRPVLDEELNRLPLKYRAPVVLHYFEGKTYAQAAQALGCPAGTVSTLLAQARHLLRGRLARRGLALTSGLLATILSENAASAMAPAALMDSTLKAAALFAAGQAVTASLISAKAATLTEGVLKAMFLTKLKIGAALVLALGALGASAGVMGYRLLPTVEAEGPLSNKPDVQVADADPPKPDKPKQEIERLRQENEALRQELQAVKIQLNSLHERSLKTRAAEDKEAQPVTFQGKTADYWLLMLKDRDPGFRVKAINALGAIGVEDKRVIPALIKSLKDKAQDVAYAAASALGNIGKEAVPSLLELLKGKDKVLRKWAAVSLSNMGPEAKEAVPVLIESLEDEDENVRVWAAGALGRMAPESKSAIPALIKLLKKGGQAQRELPVEQFRTPTVDALSRFHEAAVPALSEALKDRDDNVRAAAAETLALIGSAGKGAIPNLISALRDKEQQVRQNATSALVRIGAEAVPALVEALKDKDPAIRAGSAQALGEMGSTVAASAVPALVKAMGDEDKRVREAAAQAYKHFPAQGQTDP